MSNSNIYKFFLIVGVLIIVCSCNEDDNDGNISLNVLGYQYLPLKINQENIYQVDSIIYNDFNNSVDTISFQRREVIADTLAVLNDRVSYLVNIYERANDSANWHQIKSISKSRTTIRYEHLEDNLTIIPLVFPISLNGNWDGNLLNTRLEENFRYTSVHQPYIHNSVAYDSVISVEQRDEENRIQQIFTEEKYAANVGLIYRKDINLETDLNGTVESGYKATLRLIEFKP